MVTAAALYHVLHAVNITIDVREVCVFLAPLFSSLTVLVTYYLTKELKVRLSGRGFKAGSEKWLCVFGGSMHNEAKPIFYFGYLGGRKVLYSGHVGGR